MSRGPECAKRNTGHVYSVNVIGELKAALMLSYMFRA
jgi:hypothetical protein